MLFRSFTVVAKGVAKYQWQCKFANGDWFNSSSAGKDTASVSFKVTETNRGLTFRCELTDIYGEIHYTDSVSFVLTEFTVNYDSYSITYEILDGSSFVSVKSYSGDATVMVIPQNPQEGYTVTEIGAEAFMNNTNLQSITLPSTVTAIRARAFKGCTSLSEMN